MYARLMAILARRLEQSKSVVGTLLAGLLLLCAIDAPRSRPETNDWRATATASPFALRESALRAADPATRVLRTATRDVTLLPTRAFAVDLLAPASSRNATLARIDVPNAVAVRGYDATAPPRLS